MAIKDQKKAAKRWEGKGYEKGQSQQFWMDLLTSVYGVENISDNKRRSKAIPHLAPAFIILSYFTQIDTDSSGQIYNRSIGLAIFQILICF